MKAQLAVIMLLVASVFAVGIAAAESGKLLRVDDTIHVEDSFGDVDSSVTSIDIASGISAQEIEAEADVQADIEAKDSSVRAFPAQVLWGNGWATNGNEGYLAQIAIVQKVFVRDKDLNVQQQVTRGILHIQKLGNYRFQSQMNVSDTNARPTSMTFDVYGSKRDKQQGVIGKLTLNQDTSYNGNFKTWKGTLKLSSGQSYDLHLAIDQRPFRKASSQDLQKSKDDDSSGNDSERDAMEAKLKAQANAGIEMAKPRWRQFFDKMFSKSNSGSNSGSN